MLERPQDFRQGLVEHSPILRAYARRLTSNPSWADDLVQETMLKALANETKFTLGTNLRAWLFRILKNTFLSEIRKEKQVVGIEMDDAAEVPVALPNQIDSITLREVRDQIASLPAVQRTVLELVGQLGWSYEDAADFCNCEIGTIKSRLSRARTALANLADCNSPV